MAKDTKFKKGQSGNPSGKPKGARNKATLAAEALLDGEAEAGIFKSLGVLAGVPDLVLLFPGGRCAFIEIKAPKGYLSANQKAFKSTVEYFGFPFAECRGVDEAERFVRGLIANPEHPRGDV
jgi:hypothetical protein